MADRIVDVSVASGKYRVVMEHGGPLHALRHGEPWRDLVGDNLVFMLAVELERCRDACAAVEGE